MKRILERCCGLDVHKDTVTACLIVPDADGNRTETVRTFGTMTVERNLLLGAAQDEGPQGVRQQAPRFFARIARQPAGHLQHFCLAQHAWVQEFEQAPQFAEVILHRRPAQHHPVRSTQ